MRNVAEHEVSANRPSNKRAHAKGRGANDTFDKETECRRNKSNNKYQDRRPPDNMPTVINQVT